jgi:hypothetical protein
MPTTDTMTRRARKLAQGYRDPRHPTGRKVAITFDDETFSQMQAISASRNVSFGAVVRELVEFGLIDSKESGR